ncbi:MAG: tRNA (adenosine(37)-N6)-threonylcarbamoyltransferase complex ATPase subunit type 1 TsaE [Bifidobacteriaceae bacterium]|jgi:tRNA threonylcarbamoyladenosine biosynthesis protein TsaE|nr:tRNA (adenosine(37)-N6)-threonylcarbamoyltransferase complex ATPase subunit type 1 TsaE [Bifidobacteriaceae bacterium]
MSNKIATAKIDTSKNDTVKIESLSQLDHFCEEFASDLELGTIIVISGKLGAGKTTFAKHLAKHLGVQDIIISPTFTLERVYKMKLENGKVGNFIHIDAYRFGESTADIYNNLESLDLESCREKSIIVIEWGEKVLQFLDGALVHINVIRETGITDNQTRILNIEYKTDRGRL